MDNKVFLLHKEVYKYPDKPPFRPSVRYPEYPFSELSKTDESNEIYEMVRESFHLMNLDPKNYGSTKWNPLSEYIKPGQSVLIKPNLVSEGQDNNSDRNRCLYTHPSVTAAVIDYVIIALNGNGNIIIGDAPVQECDFEKLITVSGYKDLISWYKKQDLSNITIEFKDLRRIRAVVVDGVHHHIENDIQETIVDIGNESEFTGEVSSYYKRLRIENYAPALLASHNNEKIHEYIFAKDVLECDCFINMPKPKTHRKAGVTAALKNLIGTISRKECIAHHTAGSKNANHGDQYLKRSLLKSIDNKLQDWRVYYSQEKQNYKLSWVFSKISRCLRKVQMIFHCYGEAPGSWFGNDTISRSIIDVNRILFYSDKKGKMCDTIQRKYLIIADMIIAGQKNGPMNAIAKNVGMIATGTNPVAFDEIIAKLIGINLECVPTLTRAKKPSKYKLCYDENEPIIVSNVLKYDKKPLSGIGKSDILYFIPPDGWIEVFEKKSE